MAKDYQKMQFKQGEIIRKLIKDAGYKTLEDFAEDYGCCVKTASRIVNNGINNMWAFIDLCLFLKIDYLDVLKQMEEEKEND